MPPGIKRLSRPGPIRDRILSALKSGEYVPTPKVISDSGGSRSSVHAALSRLWSQGVVDHFVPDPAPGGPRVALWLLRLCMTIDEAKEMLVKGVEFGVVFMCVDPTDRNRLKEWYVLRPGLPNLAARRASTNSANVCGKCGGILVRTGTCETCQMCGDSGGCG